MTVAEIEELGYRVYKAVSVTLRGIRKHAVILQALDEKAKFPVGLSYSHDGEHYTEPVGLSQK